MLQEQYKKNSEICEKMSKLMFFPQNQGLIPNKLPNYSFFYASAHVMSNHNSFTIEKCVKEKYKIFPEICEKMSKIFVFYQKVDSNI